MTAAAVRADDESAMEWTAAEITRATGARPATAVERVQAIGTDSRQLPAGALFVALRGVHHDGHAFAAAACAAGAAAVLVDHVPPDLDPARAFVVSDTLRALGDLAAFTRRRWGGRVVAITGSNGKTTTKEMLAAIAATAYGAPRVLKTHGNENNLIGVPLTFFRLRGDEALAVVEMGMNAFGEIGRLTAIAAPDVGVITNVGAAHLEGVGDLAGVARAKGELFAALSAEATIAANMDDPWVARLAAGFRGRRIEFGRGRAVCAAGLESSGLEGVRFALEVEGRRAAVHLRGAGVHNVHNALAAAAAAHALGIDLETITAGLNGAALPKMRMQVVRLGNGVNLINDAYNANPDSAEVALDALAHLPGRSIAVLGEMRELGAGSAALHARVGAHAAACGIAWLIAVGPQAAALAAAARGGGLARVDTCADAATAAALVVEHWQAGDTVLVKGSRGADDEEGVRRYGARMAEVVARLTGRGGAS
jgi:UDP-N-acetylmuramoyl-tripeptide--D-alanyl-D-alanine ligase